MDDAHVNKHRRDVYDEDRWYRKRSMQDRERRGPDDWSYANHQLLQGMQSLQLSLQTKAASELLPPVDPFNGDTRSNMNAFEEFLTRFNRKFEGARFASGGQKITLFETHLRGRAAQIFRELPSEVSQGNDFERVIELMEERLGEGKELKKWEADEEWRKLERRNRNVGEFTREIERLASIVLKGAPSEMIDNIKADTFLRGFSDWSDHYLLMETKRDARPGSKFDTVKEKARLMEASKVMSMRMRGEKEKDIGKGDSGAHRESMPRMERETTCYTCKGVGHISRVCPNKLRYGNRDTVPPSNTGGANSPPMNGPQYPQNAAQSQASGANAVQAQEVHASVSGQVGRIEAEEVGWLYCNTVVSKNRGQSLRSRLIASAIIEGKERKVLIDTGSDVSVISRRALNELSRGQRENRHWFAKRMVRRGVKLNHRLRDASNREMKVDSVCKLSTTLREYGEGRGGIHFHIVPGLNDDIIIGMSGLKELGLELELRKID